MASRHTQPYAQHDYPSVSSLPITAPISRASLSDWHDEDLREPVVSPIMSRTPSVASNDRFSAVSGLTSTTQFPSSGHLQHVHPQPAYVARFGATQVVSEHRPVGRRPSSSEDDGDRINNDDVKFSTPALALVNAFLDYLLLSFLSTARSTSLHALKPAVTKVLKGRLARDAIASAEEELQELLAGGEEEEEENTKQNTADNNRRWDLELVWKRTRLRVMVYMRLGEMEDDDEERYVKEEELFQGMERRFSQTFGLVSWAAAIFLTGVLEYVAEQILQVAGAAAHTRARRQSRSAARVAASLPSAMRANGRGTQRVVTVEEHDVEKVALHSTLGRLWRTWRKSLRANAQTSTPTHRFSRSSNDNYYSAMSMRRGSLETPTDGSVAGGLDEVPEMQYPEHVLASNIPLPIGDRQRDVDEIEVPGLARDPDFEQEDGNTTPTMRRNSFTDPSAFQTVGGLPTPESFGVTEDRDGSEMPALARTRSMSVPTAARTPLALDDLPGAYPKEVAEEAVQPFEQEIREEQKANAQEMASHKRASMQGLELLDKVTSQGSSAEPRKDTVEPEEGAGPLGGAVVAASAAAKAGGPAVRSSREHLRIDSEDAALSQAVDEKDVDERDKRKSLLDIKDLIAPVSAMRGKRDNPEVLAARKISVSSPDTAPMVVRHSSDESQRSSDSRKSYTLRNKEIPQQSLATRQHMRDTNRRSAFSPREDGIGVARTSDMIVGSDPVEQEAREPARRPSRLVIGATPPQKGPSDSPTTGRTDSPPRANTANSGTGSLASKTDRPQSSGKPIQASASEDPRSTLVDKAQKRRSIPGAAFTSAPTTPVAERIPQRQSWSAKVQQLLDEQQAAGAPRPMSGPPVPVVPATHRPTTGSQPQGMAMQDHPAIQRMANLKRDETKTNPADPDVDPNLTSSSIRGPEDFDMYAQEADTTKYSVSPQTVRDKRSQSGSAPLSKRESAAGHTSAPSLSREAGSRDSQDARVGRNPASRRATISASVAEAERQPSLEKRKSVSRPPTRNNSAHRRSGLMAREPRVMTESTRDFADFIRSTGPDREDQGVRPVMNPANMSTASLHSMRSAHINGASASRSSSVASTERERSKSLTRSTMDTENIPPVPPMPAKAGKKSSLQARTATGAGDSNSELIDFIRSGPSVEGERRIPRSVAPFRSTMDSEQFSDLGMPPKINGERDSRELKLNTNLGGSGLLASKSQSSLKSRPSPGSMNTRAGALLASNADATVHPAHSGQRQSLAGKTGAGISPSPAGFNDTTPVRKRHRNKDPYAMYLDDEDNDLLTALPQNKRQEESLADFLNNTEPPMDNAPRPLVNGNSAHARTANNRNSMSSLRSTNGVDAGRTKSMQSSGGPRPAYTPSVRSVASTSSNRRPGSQQAGASALPPLPSQKPRMEAKSPGATGKPPASGDSRESDDQPRIGAFHKQSNTKDLIDFLKSGPDEDDKSAPAPSIGRQSKLNPKDAEKARKKAEKEAIKNQVVKKPSFFERLKGARRKT